MRREAVLSDREQEIAAAYGGGFSYRQIAARLNIAPATVRTHVATVYRKLGVATKIELGHRLQGAPAGTVPDFPRTRLRVGVLSLADATGSGGAAGIAATGAAEIASALGQSRELEVAAATPTLGPGADLRVHARRLGLGYLVLARVGVPGEAPRLLVELVDGRTATIRWSAAYPLPAEQPCLPIPTLAARVATQLGGVHGTIVALERERLATLVPASADPHQLYLQAGGGLDIATRDWTLACAGMAERCTTLAPRFARGWLMLAWLRNEIFSYGWGDTGADHRQREDAVFRRAVDLDPRDLLGAAYLAISRAKVGAVAEAQRLVAFVADGARAQPDVAAALSLTMATVAGQPERALDLIDRARDACPEPPAAWGYMEARAAFLAGRHERALTAAVAAPHSLPKLVFQMLAATEIGETREAVASWGELRRLVPHFTFDWYAANLPITHPDALARYHAAAGRLSAAVRGAA